MQTIRERWLVLTGLIFLLGAGNFFANRTDPGRETLTFVVLVIGILAYMVFERAGWVKQFYLLDRSGQAKGYDSVNVDHWRSILLFGVLSLFYIGYVALTGGAHSPLFCILYLPPLIVGLRYGQLAALSLSLLFAAVYIGVHIVKAVSFGPADTALLSFPVAALFGSILHGRLEISFRSIAEKVTEVSALMDVLQMLETAIDLTTTINLLLINAQRIVDADICAVYLLEPGTLNLRFKASSLDAISSKVIQSFSINELEPLTSEVILTLGRTPEGSAQGVRGWWPDAVSEQCMFAPLIGSEGFLGLLYVGRRQDRVSFEISDEESLARFCSHVSMPLQKALYQENLSVLAFRDQMTGLCNFRYFETRLAEDVLRAKRYHQEVSLLLLDIDHFKMFNDRYGHKAGDALLKQFSFVLKDCLRESDLPARYGGEEFIVICPSATMGEAGVVAERIRSRVANTEFNIGESLLGESTRVRVTVSIGGAGFPRHAQEAGDLVRQADRALYAAKERGRNRFVSCDDIPTVSETLAARSAA